MELHDIFLISLAIVSSISTVFPFVIGLKQFKHLPKEYKILFALVGAALLTEITSYILTYVFTVRNMYMINSYIILEICLISTFYILIFSNRFLKIISGLFIFSFLWFAIYSLINSIHPSFDHVVLTTESVVVIFFSILGFSHLLKHSLYKNILDAPLFWFNTAFLIYFSGNLFLHIFSKYLQEHALYTFFEMWAIWHSLLNISFYSLISIGFWKTRTSQISNS